MLFRNKELQPAFRMPGRGRVISGLPRRWKSVRLSTRKKKSLARTFYKGFDLGDQVDGHFGNHRSGWSYAISSIADLHRPRRIFLDTFIERTFVWGPNAGEPHNKPWIGFIHVPPGVPEWFQYKQSNEVIFRSKAWKESFALCIGLITLSKYHREALEEKLDIPIRNLVHPTEIPDQLWDWKRFIDNRDKKIIQIGWWLRQLHAIYLLPESDYRKILLKPTEQSYLEELFEKERQHLTQAGEFDDGLYETAEVVSYLPNAQYDTWLSENIVFLNLYDSSANNAIIECIARGTPVLVNPIPPVIEYLGSDYPLYYSDFSQAVEKANDFRLVREAHQYLLDAPIRNKLSGDYFRQSLLELDFAH